jgi:hypothetical protein
MLPCRLGRIGACAPPCADALQRVEQQLWCLLARARDELPQRRIQLALEPPQIAFRTLRMRFPLPVV